jgi:transposase-like protein
MGWPRGRSGPSSDRFRGPRGTVAGRSRRGWWAGTRLPGLEEQMLDLCADGMSAREVEALCGSTAIRRNTISRITDGVLEDVAARRTPLLERVYPIVHLYTR